jgi:hypothetical protein
MIYLLKLSRRNKYLMLIKLYPAFVQPVILQNHARLRTCDTDLSEVGIAAEFAELRKNR